MKRSVSLIALLFSGAFLFAEDDSLLFEANFDSWNVTANYSKGEKESTTFKNPSLQLRMWKGMDGKGNALAMEKHEKCAYPMKGNFNPKQGTVSFWVSPLDWKPSERRFQWFFTAAQSGFILHVYKYIWANYIFFFIQYDKAPGSATTFVASTHVEDSDWAPEKWHKIDAVWDANGMKLYVDGILPKKYSVPNAAPANPVLKFVQPLDFPEARPEGTIALNGEPSTREEDKYQRTAFDNLRIYDRPLGEKEIYEEYTKYRPSTFGSVRTRPVLSVPLQRTVPAFDGKISPGEWEDASSAPLCEIAPFSRGKDPGFTGTVRIKRDGANLNLALESTRPARPAKAAARDGALWEDDSFEIHFTMPDGSPVQFIVNSLGQIFDAKAGETKWNASVKSAAANSASGWTAELSIPFADLGGRPVKANFCIADHPEKSFDAVAWSLPSGGGFASPGTFGTLEYVNTPVRIDSMGALGSGALELRVHAENAKAEAFFEQENGTRTSFSGTFPGVWKTTLPSGNQRLCVTASSNGKTVYSYEHFYYVNSPVEIKYDCHPSEKLIEVFLNLNGAGSEFLAKLKTADGVPGKIAIVRKSDGKAVSETSVSAKSGLFTEKIPLPDLPAGEYFITADFGGVSNRIRFNMPDLTGLTAKVGVDHSVPAPWTPVTALSEKNYSVLDRVYGFGEGPFPERIVSRGSEMFETPPVLTVDGTPVSWKDFRVVETHPDFVKFTGTGASGALSLEWTGELWFDGLYKLDLSVDGKATVSALTLKYSVPREFARYVFKQGYREHLFDWKNDRIEKVFDPLKNRENSLQWTSGLEKGLAFAPVSNANWVNRPNEANLIFTRDGKRVEVTAKLISRKVEIPSKISYGFLFQGTPSRRPDPEWRAYNKGGYFVPTMQNIQFGGGGDHAENDLQMDGRWLTPSDHKPRWPERYAKALLARKENPRKSALKSHLPFRSVNYCMPMHIATNEAEYDYAIREWMTLPSLVWTFNEDGIPQTLFCCCGNTGATDILLWNLVKLLEATPEMGIYNDCAHVPACENVRHGHGGTDVFGKKYSTTVYLGQREYFLREFRIIRKYGRFLVNHVPSADIVPFVHNFSDMIWSGEEFYKNILDNTEFCYTEDISKEAWQSAFSSVIRGTCVSLLPEYDRAAIAMPKEKRESGNFGKNPEWAIRTMTPCLVHDVPVTAACIDYKTVDRWWIIKENLKLEKAVFHGYWFDSAVVSETKDMLVSRYELPPDAPYRQLIVVANFSRETRPCGIRKIPFAHTEIRELWNGKDLSASGLADEPVPAGHFLLLGIR